MIRFTTALWLAVVCLVGFGMFKVKYQVQALEEEVFKVRKQINAERDAIHVLNAEWSFLAQPLRLAELSKKYLSLAPVSAPQLKQVGDLAALPPRPAPPAEAPAADVPVPSPKPVAASPNPAPLKLPQGGTAVAMKSRSER